ncbi:H-NS family nucleoid-associated regulatory protein [Comamonas serinivorans]|nr:H-NS histone family protein [Comamonas serinivorans]
MSNYQELLKQREELEAKIREARETELKDAIAQVRALVAQFDLTADDVFSSGKRSSKSSGAKVAPKYRNPATGETWTGRGKAPKWIADKDRDQFLIA